MSHTISGNLNKDLEGKPSAPDFVNETPAYVPNNEKNYYMRIFRSSLNIFAHILIGITIGVTLFFSFEEGKLPLGSFVLHVLLCVIGYQLLMSEAILALCPHNGWSNFLRLADKKRAHTVLHIAGSVLGLVGCYIIIIEKEVHWTSLHGKYALVSMVFTVASLINGVTSLYAFEFRKYLPGNLSKVTHILFGIVAYATAAISLCYGFDKRSFKAWASPQFSYTLVGITACFTLICIITPIFNFFDKTISALRRPRGKAVSAPDFVNETPAYVPTNEGNYYMRIFRSSLNILAHILIGIAVGVSLLYTFKHINLAPGPIVLHISLCVIGYQLLMSEAILALCPHNGWSNFLRLADKKRAHTILHIAGSVVALVGCFMMISFKSVNWTTLHGKFALVSMVFTLASFFNGVTSLYAFELRKCLPGNLSKVTHILFGLVAYAAAAISLCYGYDKSSFKNWASPQFSYTLIGFTACFTLICIITPIFTFFDKTVGAFRR